MVAEGTSRQAERRAQTRAAVLDAAYEVFARDGYHSATLGAIVERAGVSKGALYYSFASKEDLFLAMLQERLAARAAVALRGSPIARPPEVTPERWALNAAGAVPLDREWNLLFWEFACFVARRPEHAQRLADVLRSFRAEIARWAEGALNQAGIRMPVPAEQLAGVIAALINGVAFDVVLAPDDAARTKETMATGMALLWRGTESAAASQEGKDDVR